MGILILADDYAHGSLTAETTKNPCRPHKAYIFLSNFFHFIVAIYGYMWYNKD